MPLRQYAQVLEKLYRRYNRRELVSPDPLEYVYLYTNPADQEVVALLASCLAYGRVVQIRRSIERVLGVLGPEPGRVVLGLAPGELPNGLEDFRHRFCGPGHLGSLLVSAGAAIRRYGSLGECFSDCWRRQGKQMPAALGDFAARLQQLDGGGCGHLLPNASRGSACKRLNLLLRWMVRQDRVDLGLWKHIPASALLIPLDTHMHRISLDLKLTRRRQADLKTAVEVTEKFAAIQPQDPVKYDFTLTRPGIWGKRDFLESPMLK